MDKDLTKDFFALNRRNLQKSIKSKLIVVSANGLIQKSLDAAYPFKQDTNFWYLTGINTPDIVLVINEDEEFLIVPKLNSARQAFDGSIDVTRLTKQSGITKIVDQKEGWDRIKNEVAKHKKLATLLPAPVRIKQLDLFTQPSRRALVSKVKRLAPYVTLEDLRPVITNMRVIKQPIELDLIQKAIDITNQTLTDVLSADKLASYKNTYEIEAAISLGFRSQGASGHGFDPIVASGKSATILHYHEHDQKMKKGELIVVDVGADYSFYSADISRTISYGQPTGRQMAVYNSVKYVQSEGFKLIKSGVLMKDFEKQIENLIGQELIKLGLIKKLDHDLIRHYYPHSCSHSLGIDPHDPADYTKPLVPGMVMAVEPGIYIPEESIGVRIEDDVLIQASQSIVLSSSLPTMLTLK